MARIIAVGRQPDIRLLARLLTLVSVLVLAGCAAMPRTPFTEAEDRVAEVVGFPGVRFWVDSPASFFRKQALNPQYPTTVAFAAGREPGLVWLALSGGAEQGAYGAGVLAGWTASGARPPFTVVSGVSTGALIAPFAFLGPRYDGVLAALYTQTTRENIFVSKGLFGLFGQSLYDPAPLRRLVEQYVDANVLAEIAAEHRRGRRLFVVTTNLDAQRGTVWDMGAIAASGHPGAAKLFHDVLIASASPPGLFPPVYFDVEAHGRRFQEMHVDGAIGEQIFTPADILVLAQNAMHVRAGRSNRLYVLVNGELHPSFKVVEPRLITIVNRSFSTLLKRGLNADVQRAYADARRSGIDFNLTFIEPGFRQSPDEPFDPSYRRELFEYGYRRALAGPLWTKTPPGPID